MAKFRYKAVTADGAIEEGEMEAPDRAAVVSGLQDAGRIPIRAEAASAGRLFARSKAHGAAGRIPFAVLLEWTRALSSLLGAGISVDRSLQIVAASAEDERARRLAEGAQKSVRAGAPLSSALAEHPAVFSRLYVSMVKAAEAAGTLDGGLARLEQYLERRHAAREQLIAALTYPSILVVVTGLSLLLIVGYVVPQFEPLFIGKADDLPWSTALVFAAADAIRRFGWLALIGAAGLGALGVKLWSDPRRRVDIDRLALRVPLFGAIQALKETSVFCRSLGMLLEGGMPLVSAFAIAKETVGNRAFERDLTGAGEAIREGAGLSAPLGEVEHLPAVAEQMVRVGEETGHLDKMLLRVSEVCDRELSAKVSRVLRILEPALIVGMGGVIGGIIASLMAAIVSVNDIPL